MTDNSQNIRIVREQPPAEGSEADVTVTHQITYWHHTGFTIVGPYSERGMISARKFPEAHVGWWEKKTQTTTIVTERIA